MALFSHPIQWIFGILLIFSSLGVIAIRNPVHASLSFLLTLLLLADLYLQLSAQFIAVMQVLVYAGAILVIFMFVIILFQDAHHQISQFKPKSSSFLLTIAASAFLFALIFLGKGLVHLPPSNQGIPSGFGTVQALGYALFVDFFFPFEAITLLFLIAIIGVIYTGKRTR